jgi:hypothetical protein
MTVDERAEATLIDISHDLFNINRDAVIESESALEKMKHALRDQIEDCAKILDKWAEVNIQYERKYEAEIMTVGAKAIRALAAPEEEKEGER